MLLIIVKYIEKKFSDILRMKNNNLPRIVPFDDSDTDTETDIVSDCDTVDLSRRSFTQIYIFA